MLPKIVQGFSDAVIDHNFLSFASLMLFDPKSLPNLLFLIQKILYPQSKQVRNSQGRINSHNKHQKVTESMLPSQLIFDLSDLFSIPNWFNKILTFPVNISLVILGFVYYEHNNKFGDKKQGPISRSLLISSKLNGSYVYLLASLLQSNRGISHHLH